MSARLCLLAAFCMPAIHSASANITTIAVTGDSAPGDTGGIFDSFQAGPLNSSGQMAFVGTLEVGGSLNSSNATGVWQFDGNQLNLVARSGTDTVPDVAEARFANFSHVGITDSGDVSLRAVLETGEGGITTFNRHGLWRYADGIGTLLARTGSTTPSGVPNGIYAGIQVPLAVAGDGRAIISNQLRTGSGGVNSHNDRGVWEYHNGQSQLLLREDTSSVPGIAKVVFEHFGNTTVNDQGDFAMIGVVKIGGTVTPQSQAGIWYYTFEGGNLIAQSGVGLVPGVPGSDFHLYSEPRINNAGEVAFRATLNGGASEGIWVYRQGGGELVGRSGAGGVPGVVGANFSSFELPHVSDSGHVLVRGELTTGSAGVITTNNQGLWRYDANTEGDLLLRTGSGNVPEVSGAEFAAIGSYTMNRSGAVAVVAELAIGPGGVNEDNNSGIWLFHPAGEGNLLIRSGDQLAGSTVADVAILGPSGGSDGRPSSFNQSGQLVFSATFTDGGSGLFLYSPSPASPSADFNQDGIVDSNDLAWWEAGFGINQNGDANGDGVTDGADFLIWQREVGSSETVLAVPEPVSLALFVMGTLAFSTRGFYGNPRHHRSRRSRRN